jgi:hypothetical protein
MITVSSAIQSRLNKMPFVTDLLADRLINIMSLARVLRPSIEELCMKEVTEETIAMAIRRMSARPENQTLRALFSETPDIMVRSHLCEFTVKKDGSAAAIEKIIKTLSLSKEHFFTITQGVFEDTLIVSDVYESMVRQVFQLNHIIAFFDHLAAITVRLPPENVEMPGVYFHILRSLAENGINVMEVVSTYREFTLLVREVDAHDAFTRIQKIFGA